MCNNAAPYKQLTLILLKTKGCSKQPVHAFWNNPYLDIWMN